MQTVFLLVLAISFGHIDGLKVGPVSLSEGQSYIDYRLGPSESNSLIQCPYTGAQKEAVKSVSWEILKGGQVAGKFIWRSNGQNEESGLLEGVVNLSRNDGDLELTNLTYDLGSFYRCTVSVLSGESDSASEEILIVDRAWDHPILGIYENQLTCNLTVNLRHGAVFPKPTVTAGIYSAHEGGYHDLVNEWKVKEHPNGSFEYFFDDRLFKINEDTPEDAEFYSEIGIHKSSGVFLSLFSVVSPVLYERSCEFIKGSEGQTITYNSVGITCFGQPRPPVGERLQVQVVCSEGYKPKGNASSVEMICEDFNKTHMWVPKSYELEDFACENSGFVVAASLRWITLVVSFGLYFHQL